MMTEKRLWLMSVPQEPQPPSSSLIICQKKTKASYFSRISYILIHNLGLGLNVYTSWGMCNSLEWVTFFKFSSCLHKSLQGQISVMYTLTFSWQSLHFVKVLDRNWNWVNMYPGRRALSRSDVPLTHQYLVQNPTLTDTNLYQQILAGQSFILFKCLIES